MPLAVFQQIGILTYWSLIIKSQDPLIRSVDAMLRYDADQGRTYNNLTCASQHIKAIKRVKIRNRYNQAPHLTQDTNGKVTTSH